MDQSVAMEKRIDRYITATLKIAITYIQILIRRCHLFFFPMQRFDLLLDQNLIHWNLECNCKKFNYTKTEYQKSTTKNKQVNKELNENEQIAEMCN